MPSQNTVKNFKKNTKYHVYNRGILKKDVFKDDTDFWVFRKILREKAKKMKGRVEIQPFSLLPNHYHFKIFQEGERDMEHFMRSTMTSYSKYFSKRHNISGRLFGSIYMAVEITSLDQERSIDKYILSNPIEAGLIAWKHVGRKI